MKTEGKLVAPKVEYHPQIPKMNYETIQKNIVDPVIIPRSVGSRKCDCASSGKTDCISGNFKNANKTLWNKFESMTCPIKCTPANCYFGEKHCRNRVLLEEQHIRNCFPRKQDGVGSALCAITEIPKGGLIEQYVGVLTKCGRHRNPISHYVAKMRSPDNEDEDVDLWLNAEKCGNLARFVNHSCAPNCE